jgi:folate-binding protein YgfZ
MMNSTPTLEQEYELIWQHGAIFDRSDRGKLSLSGADAARFLHNLCTNDILGLPAGMGCEAFLTTNKAKAIAYLLVFHQANPDQLWLDTDTGRAPAVAQHLDRYLISERVEIADRTSDFAQFYVTGPRAIESLSSSLALTTLPVPLQEVTGPSGIRLRRRDLSSGLMGFDVICPADKKAHFWESLTDHGVSPAGSMVYDILRIEAGIPVFGADIDEERMVAEVGLGVRAISYSKGCYLGQETLVMARDRGHLNRSLVGLRVEGEQPPAHGTLVLSKGKEVGRVTSSALSPRLGTIALAYVRRGFHEAGTELVLAESGRRGIVSALPF